MLLASSSEDWFQAERYRRHAHDIVDALKRLIPYPDPATAATIKMLEEDLSELDASQKEDAPWDLANYYIMSQEEREALREAEAQDEANDFVEEHALDELLEHRTSDP